MKVVKLKYKLESLVGVHTHTHTHTHTGILLNNKIYRLK